MNRLKGNWLPVSLLAAHLLLGVLYSVIIPLWEGVDEWGHYEYVNYLLANRTLPTPDERTFSEERFYQLSQPPLYYVLAALPNFWVDTSDGFEPTPNPYARTGTGKGGVNMFVHSKMEAFPYRGTALAAHLARLVSVLIGTAAVWFTYLLGGFMFPQRKVIALGAMAITAFSPQFLFTGSVITNDILVATLSSLVIFLCLRTALGEPRLKEFFLLGLSLGLALLSKYNALALIPFGLLCAVIGVIRQIRVTRSRKIALSSSLLFLFILGLIVFGSVFRSVSLYGTLTTRRFRLVQRFLADLRNPLIVLRKMHWDIAPKALRYGFVTFWSCFGWENVGVDRWIYQVLAIVCLLGAMGLLIFMLRRYPRSTKWGALLLLLAILLVLALPMYGMLRGRQIYLLRGRYLLPAISAVSLLLFLGLAQLVPQRFTRYLALVVAGGMFLWALLTPFSFILPAYARPPLLSETELDNIPSPLHVNFGNKIELVGYELEREEIMATQAVRVTLYWRCLAEMDENYTVAVHILDPNYQAYGKQNSYPGRGNYATSLWKRGETIKDSYSIGTSRRFPAPAFGQFKVALYLYPSLEHLPLLGPAAEPVGDAIIFGRFKVAPREILEPTIANATYYRFGDILALIGYDIEPVEGELRVRLYWRSLKETDRDYTVFIHLIDEEKKSAAQRDSQPRNGYYPTSLWEEGEVILDEHHVSLPAGMPEGEYGLLVGLYLLESMERLPAFDREGTRLADDQVVFPVTKTK